jgi:nitrogen fixation protein NifU and related proteins
MYSALLWEHYEEPHNLGRPKTYQRSSKKLNPVCGDSLEYFLESDDLQSVQRLSFTAQACMPVVALGSLICQWSEGKALQELAGLTEQQLLTWSGPLPPNKRHAIQLHLWALRELLSTP